MVRNPFEQAASLLSPDRLGYLAGSLGYSALSGVILGLERGLLRQYPGLSIVAAVTASPTAAVSAVMGVWMQDSFLHPEDTLQLPSETGLDK